jgi:hypothetical protein
MARDDLPERGRVSGDVMREEREVGEPAAGEIADGEDDVVKLAEHWGECLSPSAFRLSF